MLFRKDIPRSCSYCRFGTRLDDTHILCTKRGTVEDIFSCRSFKYDPFKRQPPKPKAPDFGSFTEEDFTL